MRGAPEVTNITLLGAILIGLFCLLTLVLPRKYAYIPLVLTLFLVPLGQRVMIFDINFQGLRFVITAVYLRFLTRGEHKSLRPTKVDRIFAVWMVTSFIAYSLQLMSVSAVINRAGFLFDSFGAFYAFRVLLQTREDVWNLIRVVALVIVPVAGLMWMEQQTGQNMFARLVGGVPELTAIRDGRIRSQGPFTHSILAGTMGAIWLPVFLALGWSKKSYLFCAVGALSGLVMVYTSGSSTPILSALAGLLALAIWPLRRHMRLIRRGIVAGLVVLQLVMNRPIWFIFAMVNVIAGSTGWHRSNLIDAAVKHWYQWFLIGYERIASWGVWAGDVTNHYLLEGFRGGLLAMMCLIAIMTMSYSRAGGVVTSKAKVVGIKDRRLMWALGSMLFAHTVTFFSVAYYNAQTMAMFYATVGSILALQAFLEKEVQQQDRDGGEERSGEMISHMGWWTPGRPPLQPALTTAGGDVETAAETRGDRLGWL